MLIEEIRNELTEHIIPFWMKLRDQEYGGYYGYMDYDLHTDRKAVKGCILNSRITWFFSAAYLELHDERLLDAAKHGFEFLKDHCMDRKEGGIFWSVRYDGTPEDTTKHTYNQAFAIYALSTYYDAAKDEQALQLAESLYQIIETKMRDAGGYLEAFHRDFTPASNEKLSENGVLAARTMNTLLHVLEAYTEYYRVTEKPEVGERLREILKLFREKVYSREKQRQEVFFDSEYNSLIDLYSYGHDIESAWLLDRAAEVLDDPEETEAVGRITREMTQHVISTAFDGRSLPAECENGAVKEDRVWWVQAETVNGLINGYQKDPSKTEYLTMAKNCWEFTKQYVIDHREGSEWYWVVDREGHPAEGEPIVEPWKCPYHNGRMCLEVMRRGVDI